MTSGSVANMNVLSFLRYVFSACGLIYALYVICTGDYASQRITIALMTVFLSVVLVATVKDNVLLFAISIVILYANYSACLSNTFPPYSGYETAYSSDPISSLGMAVLLLFVASLLLFLPTKIVSNADLHLFDRWGWCRHSTPLVCLIFIALVGIFFFCSSGFSNTGGRAENNSIFEYSYILFILGFLVSGRKRALRTLMVAAAALYTAQAFFGGNRASVLAVVLLLFVLYFANKLDWKGALPFLVVGMLLMTALGYFRNSEEMFLLKIPDAISISLQNGLNWDTASYAFHQSLAFIRLDEAIAPDEHLYLLRQWVLSWFVGSGMVPDSSLPAYSQQLYPGMGGGFLPIYGFFYFGIPGVMIFALVIAMWFRAINKLNEDSSTYSCVLCISVAITFCRWYLYSPSPLTTGILLISILYFLMSLMIGRDLRNVDLRKRTALGGRHLQVR